MPFQNCTIYPVTGRSLFGERSDAEVIEQLAEGGAKIVQLREKEASVKEFRRLARHYRQETNQRGMLLIINDHIDIAMEVGANGVHLGRSDMPIAEARKLAGAKMIIGASAHSLEQALQAEAEGASYVNVGPIFSTPTKPGVMGIGLTPLADSVRELTIPVSTMGGITLERLDEVQKSGVKHLGVVSAIFGSDNIAATTRSFHDALRAHSPLHPML